jgi:hypothetical protein
MRASVIRNSIVAVRYDGRLLSFLGGLSTQAVSAPFLEFARRSYNPLLITFMFVVE